MNFRAFYWAILSEVTASLRWLANGSHRTERYLQEKVSCESSRGRPNVNVLHHPKMGLMVTRERDLNGARKSFRSEISLSTSRATNFAVFLFDASFIATYASTISFAYIFRPQQDGQALDINRGVQWIRTKSDAKIIACERSRGEKKRCF